MEDSRWLGGGVWALRAAALVSSTLLLGILDTDFTAVLSEKGWRGAPAGELPLPLE